MPGKRTEGRRPGQLQRAGDAGVCFCIKSFREDADIHHYGLRQHRTTEVRMGMPKIECAKYGRDSMLYLKKVVAAEAN